ncbi:MAG: DUF2116 family Zn-ribbon domain-containing protein [Candidatus Bathyarchaeia archaeon]
MFAKQTHGHCVICGAEIEQGEDLCNNPECEKQLVLWASS